MVRSRKQHRARQKQAFHDPTPSSQLSARVYAASAFQLRKLSTAISRNGTGRKSILASPIFNIQKIEVHDERGSFASAFII
jgi:hypothetical protein